MPWINEEEKNYWMPEVLPEPTEEYQNEQSEKRYLTKEGKERMHPGWTYADNTAYVDDEYLFQNEDWKLIVDDGGPNISANDLKYKTKNIPEDWEEIDEKTVRVTYSIFDFSPERILEHERIKWQTLKNKRDYFLSNTDWIVVRAVEENLVVSDEVVLYRQQLRDFPETIIDILSFDIEDDTLWPTKPEVYFRV